MIVFEHCLLIERHLEVVVVEEVKRLDQPRRVRWPLRKHELVRQAANVGRERAHQVVGVGQKVKVKKQALEALLEVAGVVLAGAVGKRVVVSKPVSRVAENEK